MGIGEVTKDSFLGWRNCEGKMTPAGRANRIARVFQLALLILSAYALTGAVPARRISIAVVVLGAGAYGIQLMGGNNSRRKVDLIASGFLAATLIVIGGFGVTGRLPSYGIGWLSCATFGATALFYGFSVRLYASEIKRELENT